MDNNELDNVEQTSEGLDAGQVGIWVGIGGFLFGIGMGLGSVIIMKFDGRALSMLVGDEFEKAAAEFKSRLITLVCDGQEFSALELL